MPSPIAKECEPIQGYTIKEFLGAGGYGEVWSAAAPGGLTKAIKFVYGQHSEKRAAAELKSLERIRELRHPFLLSLERYEVIDGRLVIVTELADCSLRERFNVCRENGLPGIPRNELLHYLREAADGLDFMLKRGLQHLDVKPANLLIVAGHIKIADFGLVKDLENVSVTLIGGLTPVYSAPELFRGRPNDRSDQYSLAVVFQEMLSGTLPFTAGSPGEWAVRQIKARPDLSSIPTADRAVVARALSKDPRERFQTCIEFVEALLGGSTQSLRGLYSAELASTAAAESAATPKPELGSTATPVHTVVCGPETIAPVLDTDHQLMRCLPPLPRAADQALGPITLPKAKQPMVPMFVCAVGGTGARVLRHLCRRINDRFGDRSAVPTIQMLLLDTDAETLVASTGGDDRSALRRDETLALPLRRPQQYRDDAQKMLRWLKRRWLYNVPRSLKTEGLRPLGRLAMADHADALLQTIERGVRSIVEPQSIEAASSRTGEQFRNDALRIYLVASVAGGTGSGMVLDVAYALQGMLAGLALKQKEVHGILTHSTTKNVPLRDLAVLNTLSWLTEYNHFNRPGGVYPGDETCGLQSVDPGNRAFDSTYLSHLGDDLDERAFDQATRSVANYVYLDGLTPAAAFFAACRHEPDDAPELLARHAKVRTFGLHGIACIPDHLVEATAAGLCRALLLQRCGTRADGSAQQCQTLERDALAAMATQGADLPSLIQKARTLVGRAGAADEAEFDDRREFYSAESSDDRCALTEHQNGDAPPPVSRQRLDEITTQLTRNVSDKLRSWLVGEIDGQQASFAQGARLAGALSHQYRAARNEARCEARQLADRRRELLAQARAARERSTTTQRRPASRELDPSGQQDTCRLDSATLHCVVRASQNLTVEMDQFAEQLTQLARDLEALAQLAGEKSIETRPPHRRDGSKRLDPIAREVTRLLSRHHDRLMRELNDALNENVLRERGGWFRVLTDHPQVRSTTLSSMRRLARHIVRRAVDETNLLGKVFAAREAGKAPLQLEACLEQAAPLLSPHAGSRRLLAVLPASLTKSGEAPHVVRELNGKATVTSDAANELTFCYETNWLSLPHFAAALIERSPHRADAVGRLHARCDVNWSSLWKGNWSTREMDDPNPGANGQSTPNSRTRD